MFGTADAVVTVICEGKVEAAVHKLTATAVFMSLFGPIFAKIFSFPTNFKHRQMIPHSERRDRCESAQKL